MLGCCWQVVGGVVSEPGSRAVPLQGKPPEHCEGAEREEGRSGVVSGACAAGLSTCPLTGLRVPACPGWTLLPSSPGRFPRVASDDSLLCAPFSL